MNDERLEELLHSLPREAASPGFTGRVMGRIAAGPARRQRRLPPLAAAAMLVILSTVGITHYARRAREERAREALRIEHRQLELELARLKAESEKYPSVIYVGGDDDVDYVIDLREQGRAQPSAEAALAGNPIPSPGI